MTLATIDESYGWHPLPLIRDLEFESWEWKTFDKLLLKIKKKSKIGWKVWYVKKVRKWYPLRSFSLSQLSPYNTIHSFVVVDAYYPSSNNNLVDAYYFTYIYIYISSQGQLAYSLTNSMRYLLPSSSNYKY